MADDTDTTRPGEAAAVEAVMAAMGEWPNGNPYRKIMTEAVGLAYPVIAAAAREHICGATDNNGAAVCTLPPHSVELLPEGHPMHRRFHQDRRGGVLRAEWSSVVDESDVGRMWPDGHIGTRAEAARVARGGR